MTVLCRGTAKLKMAVICMNPTSSQYQPPRRMWSRSKRRMSALIARLLLHQREEQLLERHRHLVDHLGLDAGKGLTRRLGMIDQQPRTIALALENPHAGQSRGIAREAHIDLAEAAHQLVHASGDEQLALVDDGAVIGETLDIGKLMRGDDDGAVFAPHE